ncbi:MAG: hypothetical protein AAGJ86_11690, partial [Pseudomonadota bacterium]
QRKVAKALPFGEWPGPFFRIVHSMSQMNCQHFDVKKLSEAGFKMHVVWSRRTVFGVATTLRISYNKQMDLSRCVGVHL